jgi:hypothetical protein
VKYRYPVTNWAEYDRAWVNRGHLMIGFDEYRLKDYWTPPPPVGRVYSDVAIQTCLTLKTLFRWPYRAPEGLLKLPLDLPVLDHTHLSPRARPLTGCRFPVGPGANRCLLGSIRPA